MINAETDRDEKWKLIQDSLTFVPFRVKLMATEHFEGSALEQFKQHKRQQYNAKGKGKGKSAEQRSEQRSSEHATMEWQRDKSSWSGDKWWENQSYGQSYGSAKHSWQ